MSELNIEDRQIVVPGDVLASGMDYLPSGGAYRSGENILSSILGMATLNGRVVKVIPLRGKYLPKPGDIVIGRVVEMTSSIWFVNIGGYNDGILAIRDVPEYIDDGADLSRYYNFGDYIVGKVVSAQRGNFNVSLKGPGAKKLYKGRIINIDSAKVPRVIGKQGSMISLIKEKTGCRIIVGQNGLVWIQGTPEGEFAAIEAVNLINERGHHQGLTDEISSLLESKNIVVERDDDHHDNRNHSEEEEETDDADDREEQATRTAYNRKRGGRR